MYDMSEPLCHAPLRRVTGVADIALERTKLTMISLNEKRVKIECTRIRTYITSVSVEVENVATPA